MSRTVAAVSRQQLRLGTLLSLCALLIGSFRIRSFDTFWHLVSGSWILQNRSLPRIDPFRFTSIDQPWIDHEWLFQILLATADRLMGLDGLIALRATIVIGLAWVLFQALQKTGISGFESFSIALAILVLARLRFLIRPELISLLALALLLGALQRYRRSGRIGVLIGVAGLTIVWVNCHLGALIAAPLVGLYLLGTRLPGGSGPPNRGVLGAPWTAVVGFPVLLALAVVVNPHGIGVFTVPGKIAASLQGVAGTNPEWLPLMRAPRPWVFVVVATLATAWGLEWRKTRRIDPATVMVTLALLSLTLMSVRHRGLFYIGAAFALAESVASLRTRGWDEIGRRGWLPVVITALVGLGVVFPPNRGPIGVANPMSFGLGLEPGRFPIEAANQVEEWDDLGNVFNDVATGGYLLWRWYPERLIFADGRNEVHPGLLRELTEAVATRAEWSALLDRYAIDGAVVDYVALPSMVLDESPAPRSQNQSQVAARSSLYFSPDEFALVYWDDVSMFFVRRSERRVERLQGAEYIAVRPDESGLMLARAETDPGFRHQAMVELERRVAEPPYSQRAVALLDAIGSLESGIDR